MKKIIFCLISVLFFTSLNAEKDIFISNEYKFKIKKLNQWHFQNIEILKKYKSRYNENEEEISNEYKKVKIGIPILITKYKEPYKGINPMMQITIGSGNKNNVNMKNILNNYLEIAPNMYRTFQILQDITEIKKTDHILYQIKYKYSLKNKANSYYNLIGSITLVEHNNSLIMIRTQCDQNENTEVYSEFDEIINSIEFF